MRQLFHKNYTYWWKSLDWCWTMRIFSLRLRSFEEINSSSSSSWKSTSKKWWSNWILENHRQSSRTFLVLSPLVWRQSGRAAWQEDEKRKDTSIVLIRQEQSCASKLFEVIQDANLLTLRCRTMWLFRTVSSSTFIMSGVQSIYISSSIRIDIWGSKFEQQSHSILSASGSVRDQVYIHAVVNSFFGLGSCLSCGKCTALVCCTDTLRIQAIRLKS